MLRKIYTMTSIKATVLDTALEIVRSQTHRAKEEPTGAIKAKIPRKARRVQHF